MTEIKMKSKLTPEQSQRLIELGVDPSKASEVKEFDDELSQWTHRGSSIFTLSDILSLLPEKIPTGERNSGNHIVLVCPLSMEWEIRNKVWEVSYKYEKHFIAPELIDALFELLVWCITNKHLKL